MTSFGVKKNINDGQTIFQKHLLKLMFPLTIYEKIIDLSKERSGFEQSICHSP